MGFGQGLSGLNAASQNLDVIGNNIANSSTVGFKSASIAFADVYASSRVGLGVQVASVNQRFTTGNLSTTGNQFDMAIDGDKGLFRMLDPSGVVVYSRNGQFAPNRDLELVNAQGHRLTGYMANADGTISAELGPIKVPVGNIDPKATTNSTIKANFDSRSEGIAGSNTGMVGTGVAPDIVYKPAFDLNNPENYTHSLPMTVYDSLGNPHQLTQYFVKVEGSGNTWDVYYKFGDKFISSVAGTTEGSSGTADAPGSSSSGIGAAGGEYGVNDNMLKHRLVFDSAGRIVGPHADFDDEGKLITVHPYELSITDIGADGSPAANLTITLDYNGSTQFGGDFSPASTQNGYTTGEYASMSIASNGDIIANYTNDESKVMGQLVLADFNNLNGLKPIGGNAWIETGVSGAANLGKPGTNGLATLKGQAVEESNVDMSQELVNMIIAQRTYQANAQTIKTQDQILQTLITLR
ncbi:flagellar hook protein FlgE [Paenalcaligenes faecalis]|uniref:flagellar hook protein FlgE n=1 Tax=Paenalcaligenes faecalis TaxID=2980099 RepID=UPI0022B942EE|nr:flagellar hook protein FlgE [Paenalcaligenes faecalis]